MSRLSFPQIALTGFLTLAIGAPAVAQGFSSLDLAKDGRAAYRAGDYDKAIRFSERVTRTGGRNNVILGYAFETLCMTYDAQGDAIAAAKACARAIEHDDRRDAARKLLAGLSEE